MKIIAPIDGIELYQVRVMGFEYIQIVVVVVVKWKIVGRLLRCHFTHEPKGCHHVIVRALDFHLDGVPVV